MKPKRLNEVLALLDQPELQSWWAEVQKRRAELEVAQKQQKELLSEASLTEFRSELSQKTAIDTLYRAGEFDDAAASMLFEGTDLENRSYRAVSDFEEQRFKVSEIWDRLGAAEKMLDERRESHAKANSKKSEAELKAAERTYRTTCDEYERETGRKNRLWDEVERIWARSAEVNLLVAEHRLRAKRVRKEAEALFAEAEEGKRRGADFRAKADAASSRCEAAELALRATLDRAREQFGCAVGNDFLYFSRKENPKVAFCVSLIEDHDNYNVEVLPLSVYLVDRQRGVAFLEPSTGRAASAEEGDRRFEEYFLRGRKGAIGSAASN
jgi:hypothetical protein